MTNKKILYKPVDPEIVKLAQLHGGTHEAALEVLKDLNADHKLNQTTITETARVLHLPAHAVHGLATFYSMLSLEERKKVLRVCDGPVCWLKRASFQSSVISGQSSVIGEWEKQMPDYTVERTSCLGLCDRVPAILVEDEQAGPVEIQDVNKVCEGWRGVPTDYSKPRKGEVRVMIALIGKIDPDSIDDALSHGIYDGLKKALQSEPTVVLAEVESSGLQGRGGAGFPVGRKWRFVASEMKTPRYIICNADESEPLIFKDRVLMDTNPHQLLEGMIVAGYICGASEAWIYIRGEYEGQARRLERAIEQAEAKNLLGENILGSGFSFKIHVHRGAGAYICGEETALIESLEGKRGEPRLRPPYPPTYGFRGQPTAVNNVESFCAVPHIVKNGAEWWRTLTDDPTPGTKVYMVLGHVKNPGLFEAPFGLTLRQIINDFGSGMMKGSTFNFALCGGAAGTIVDDSLLDIPIDFASSQKGISLGAGAFLICDQTVSPIAVLRELLHFFTVESCGKCTPCRVGTWRSLEILNRMVSGQGRQGDTDELKTLAALMQDTSFCGLGQSVAIPMKSVLTHFGAEFAKAEKQLVIASPKGEAIS
ncbi:MAG: NADH-ubiquinone oxidoreductase-F iron-sulfur binding region domain-containing protein [Anaerolineales bacterium]|nr:NADH-ubiquinone oxidoreductase-F iron-sulfur binding region domain-containing protein [Anaerolineales bacterium]